MVRPRFVLCLLGTWTGWEDLERVLPTGWTLDREYAQLAHDPRMPRAFEASADRVDPSFTDEDEAAIASHTAVVYVVSPPLEQAFARDEARAALAMIDAALGAGATAVKCESSGIAHGAAKWRELATQMRSDDALESAWALKDAFVRRPIGDGTLLYSCGMHLLGERDAEVTRTDDIGLDLRWLDLLVIYLLAEQPARGVEPGEKFGIETDGERRVLEPVPCSRYEADDLTFNPYGYWRLGSLA